MILHLSPLIATTAGFGGAASCLIAYAYGTAVRVPNPLAQHGFNLVGAVLLIVSLLVDTNPAALALECAWGAIAAWGLAKALRRDRA